MSDIQKKLPPGKIIILPSESSARRFSSRHIWPKTKFIESHTVPEQLAHILSEIDEATEAVEAVEMLSNDAFRSADPVLAQTTLPFFRELADVQASIETLWGILDRLFGERFSEAMILSWVEEKNRKRGYYVEESKPQLLYGRSLFSQIFDDWRGVPSETVLPDGTRGNEEEHF